MKLNYISFGMLLKNSLLVITGATLLSSCAKKDANSPGIEYMPDMVRAVSYETYGDNPLYDDSMASRKPVAGTIPRNFEPYSYPNTPEGYEAAGTNLKNPILYSAEVIAEGEVLYGKYCTHCHGTTGAGDGLVAAKLPGPPPPYTGNALKDLPQGKIFHSIFYGKGMMGAHAPLINKTECWKLVHYVQKLQGHTMTAATDTSAVKSVVAEAKTK